MQRLASYVNSKWNEGTGKTATLFNPSTEEEVATATAEGIDFKAALDHCREKGGAALRELTFVGRGELLQSMAKAIHSIREELIAMAIANGGNTRGDAKFDIDGASFTLSAYAELAKELGDKHVLADGDAIQVGRTARLAGQHVYTPRHGVAVHINAFNFPAWGLAEKAATAILGGMPVLSKPATATALVTYRMVKEFVDQKILPEGALALVTGSPGDLLSHLIPQDVVAFTGSSKTAATIRAMDPFVKRSVQLNVEADSLNIAILGPDVSSGETMDLFVRDVATDMTQKTGQKCTAIRRILVPTDSVGDVKERLIERLGGIVVGNPATDGVRMGPVATKRQYDDVRAGIASLAEESTAVFGGDGTIKATGAAPGKGYFVSPVLFEAKSQGATKVHEEEVFGPVATIVPYDGKASTAADLAAKGQGGLVASLYSDDRSFLKESVLSLAPYNGRLYLGSEKIAAQSPGPGMANPNLLHGGPGRAGGGEELGGLRGVTFYMQRTALQGDKSILAKIID